MKKKWIAWIGTYASALSGGIHTVCMDAFSGALERVDVCTGIENPSFLTLSHDRCFLYAVSETAYYQDRSGGSVAAFKINESTPPRLKHLNTQPTHGASPCHLCVDDNNQFLICANYSEGTLSICPLASDGSIMPVSNILTHHGSSIHPLRQEKAHAHYVALSHNHPSLFAVDLGMDQILRYELTAKEGKFIVSKPLMIAIEPGSGPRHMVFHPLQPYAYLINELTADIIVYQYHPKSALAPLRKIQCISTLPLHSACEKSGAAIHTTPDGKYLYASNRNHNSIAVFRIDCCTGQLSLIQHVHTQGICPRDFSIDPLGKFLMVANQQSHSLVTFSIEPDSGRLSPTGNTLSIEQPTCIQFL